jgi:glyoxylase-like metal-dependent hydrolase (beta-lactamase superfamily II)
MPKTKTVIPGIWWVGCSTWGGVTEQLSDTGSGNVFLVGGNGDFALIDAGTAEGVPFVLENAASVGVNPRDIHCVVITHAHSDHFLGAPLLREKTGAKLAAAPECAKALSGIDAAKLFLREDHGFKPFSTDLILDEGGTLTVGPYTFHAMMTPGHIPGSVTLFGEVSGKKCLFTGDSAIGDQAGMSGVVGWLDGHWQSNPKTMLKSLVRMRDCSADIMLPDHGFPIVGRRNVRKSLSHCIARVKKLLAIPSLGSMMMLDLTE